MPNGSFGPFIVAQEPVRFSRGLAERAVQNVDLADLLSAWPGNGGGWSGGLPAQPAAAIFTFAPGQQLAGQQITLTLVQQSALADHNLGRFRISSTTAPLPLAAEPPLVELPLFVPKGSRP